MFGLFKKKPPPTETIMEKLPKETQQDKLKAIHVYIATTVEDILIRFKKIGSPEVSLQVLGKTVHIETDLTCFIFLRDTDLNSLYVNHKKRYSHKHLLFITKSLLPAIIKKLEELELEYENNIDVVLSEIELYNNLENKN